MSNEEQKAEKSFKVCSELKENTRIIRELTIKNIPLFEEILNNEYFKIDLGDEDATWSAFLGQPDVMYSRSNVNTWIKIKKKLVDEYGMKLEDFWGIKLSKLEIIAMYSRDIEHAQKLIKEAKVLLPSDWKDLANSLMGKPVSDDGHLHEYCKFEQCKKCGHKEVLN